MNTINVLVVVAHPDDEVLGCGGTIARHAQEGCHCHILIMSEGIASRYANLAVKACRSLLAEIREHAQKASEILGACSVELLTFPDNRMDSVDFLDIVKVIEKAIEKVRPDIVYTHHCGDLNIDHQRVHQAVVTACRPQSGHPVTTLLFFETPSSTEWQAPGSGPAFVPNWFVDITATLSCKLEALQCYKDELRPWPHPRSLQAVECLALWRGASVGVEAAEAFMLGRQRT